MVKPVDTPYLTPQRIVWVYERISSRLEQIGVGSLWVSMLSSWLTCQVVVKATVGTLVSTSTSEFPGASCRISCNFPVEECVLSCNCTCSILHQQKIGGAYKMHDFIFFQMDIQPCILHGQGWLKSFYISMAQCLWLEWHVFTAWLTNSLMKDGWIPFSLLKSPFLQAETPQTIAKCSLLL